MGMGFQKTDQVLYGFIARLRLSPSFPVFEDNSEGSNLTALKSKLTNKMLQPGNDVKALNLYGNTKARSISQRLAKPAMPIEQDFSMTGLYKGYLLNL